jgi:PAS domain S-box-containing protein
VELPLIKGERLVALFTVQQSHRREWTPQDVALIEETAQRTWAAVDQARAEAASRESQARLQKAVSIDTVGVVFFTLDGRIMDANPAFERMSGYSRDELLRHARYPALTAPEFRAVTERAARQLADDGEATPYEKQLVRKDGSRWWGLFAPTRLKGRGAESECVEFVLDITATKRTEEELRRAHEELEERVRERTSELAQTNASLRAEMAERRRAEEARRELLRQLVNAQEVERRRVSRELHDELGQQMSALTLKLSMLRQAKGVDPAVRAQVESLEKIARDADSALDFIVWELRPTVLDDLGLVAALDDYVRTWSEHFGIHAEIVAPAGESMRFDPEVETVLYRVAQEALNNIAKHAYARHVELRLERGASHASLTVADDGVGFDAARVSRDAKGLGLVGMRERAAYIGGEFVVHSKPGKGTRIKVNVPLTTSAP